MQTQLIEVDPLLPIQEAAERAMEQQADLVGFPRGNQRFVAHRDDLSKMTAMGLATLPVECIAVPESSPLLQSDRAGLKASENYSRRLTNYFPVYFVAAMYELQSLMQRFEVKAYVIGGITRDLLLFQEKRLAVKDVDITLEGDAQAFTQFLTENSRNFVVEEQFPEFGTAKVRYKESLLFDFASTRQEIYPNCGALPVVVSRGVPLGNDIIRRDFTVNSLAFSIHELGQVLDYSNGMRDVQMRQLRVLHPVSFFEDPSRIVRAMKFGARFNFELGEETLGLLKQFLRYGGICYKGGGERIKQEIKGFLGAAESEAKSRWIRFFMEEGCYRLINMESGYQPTPETLERLSRISTVLPEIETTLSNYMQPDFLFDTYLCFLCRDMPDDEFQKTEDRLGLTRNEREFTEQYRRVKEKVGAQFAKLHDFTSPAEIYDLFHGLHFITVVACLVELGLEDRKHMRTVLEALLKYKRKWEKMTLSLNGNDLIELGVPKGKQIGQVLDQLLHVKLAGQLPDRLDEVQFVQTLLEKEAAQANKQTEGLFSALETPDAS
ncbi:MAG: tRNA nucleotidyltransferase/poly(A) polymerase [Vampirovibrio sp.]|jgi:tRNA nucleotidyltransferase (CCA-adding enzyme)|nr:tRNA nucleotidyltransferase/poly(A) polymerase [Vampirovibrio sp.]